MQIKLAEGHKFDRDVELLIYYKDAHQPTAVVERGKPSAKPGEQNVLFQIHGYRVCCPALHQRLINTGII